MTTATTILAAILLACPLAAGESALPADALAALQQQSAGASAPTHGPVVLGTWIWGGRADAQYRPFFEWDLRLAAGPSALAGLRARVTTLGPQQEQLRQGAWEDLGDLAASATRDVALRLNCPTFAAWKVELAWKGGSESFVGCDKQGLPVATSGLENDPLLLAVNAQAEPDRKKGTLAVTWNLWNLGGAQASGVVQTVRLLDATGKTVASADLKIAKPVPGKAMLAQKLAIPKAPAYAAMSVTTRMDAASPGRRQVLEPPASDGPDLVVKRLVFDKGTLTAEVVNHLGKALAGAEVKVSFIKTGKPATDIVLTVPELADGAETTVSKPLAELPPWDEYAVSWAQAR